MPSIRAEPAARPSATYHRFLGDPPKRATPLPAQGSWRQARHHWEAPEMRALAAAGFSGRPLLVKGEPGVGKSQLARAAAALLEWRFEYDVITPRFEPQDLLWRFDAVRRLAQAGSNSLQPERDYATPGVLWRALDPFSAGVSEKHAAQPGCVLLLDEIDKADSDLPNSLLEVLGNLSFKTRFDGQETRIPSDPRADGLGLLVVITSNDERELPLAFVRRCAVLELKVPDEQANPAGFVDWLKKRGAAQFPRMAPDVRLRAAQMVCRDRQQAPRGQGARPGLAEYHDLLRALQGIAAEVPPDEQAALQDRWLGQLSPFVLRKQAGQDQTPAPTDASAGLGTDSGSPSA